MTQKTRLTLIVAIAVMGIGLAACGTSATPTSTATLPPPTLSPARPSSTLLPATATPIPPTETPLPPTATLTPLPPTPLPSAKVIVKLMNLRSGPSTSYPVVAVLKEGDIVTVLGRTADNFWIAVKTADNTAGWCSAQSKNVQLSVDVSALATAPLPPPPARAAATAAPPKATTAALPTAANTQAPPTQIPTVQPSPVPAAQEFILYFYFGAEGCPNSRKMAPLIEQFYQQYAYHASLSGGSLNLAALRPLSAMALDIHLAASDALSAPYLIPPLQGVIKWSVIGEPVKWWGGDPAAFRSATGVTFPFGSDPGLPVDTSHIPVTVLFNKQTGVYRTATVGAVSYGTLVNLATAFSSGEDIGPASGTS